MELDIITTQDGSLSILNKTLNTTYHSKFGAFQESQHIFINHGFEYVMAAFPGERIHVLEVGLGTGLNALLTLQKAIEKNVIVSYTGIEKYPLPADIKDQISYRHLLPELEKELYSAVNDSLFETEHVVHPTLSLLKKEIDIADFTPEKPIHLVYFDAFGPGITPDMWQPVIFERLHQSMLTGSVLVTFCAQGAFKRLLKATGFIVETLPGAPGKREMTRAIKS